MIGLTNERHCNVYLLTGHLVSTLWANQSLLAYSSVREKRVVCHG